MELQNFIQIRQVCRAMQEGCEMYVSLSKRSSEEEASFHMCEISVDAGFELLEWTHIAVIGDEAHKRRALPIGDITAVVTNSLDGDPEDDTRILSIQTAKYTVELLTSSDDFNDWQAGLHFLTNTNPIPQDQLLDVALELSAGPVGVQVRL